MRLTEAEKRTYQERLLSKLAELEDGAHRLDRIAVETAADLLENLQLATDREVAISKLDREAILLGEVRDALDRILDASYGVCLECGQQMPRGRLDALPWASHCVGCQAAMDRRRGVDTGRKDGEEWEAA